MHLRKRREWERAPPDPEVDLHKYAELANPLMIHVKFAEVFLSNPSNFVGTCGAWSGLD